MSKTATLPKRAYCLSCIGAIYVFFLPLVTAQAAEPVPHIRFIYLVPRDRQLKPHYQRAIEFAALNIQGWLAQKTGGATFDLDVSIVTTIQGSQEAAWYADNGNNAKQAIAFYNNAAADLRQLNAVQFNNPMLRYVVYVDADLRCGQSGAGGNGVAIMSANDLRGLSGEAIVPACATLTAAERGGKCRWIGGSAHELLHTLGLGHSDQFDECKNPKCLEDALMMYGYTSYPSARLLVQELAKLRDSGFLRQHSLTPLNLTCSN